jgi:predicted metal-dependent hydrolase
VEDELARGLEQIHRGEYFEAHESLEDAWRAAEPAEKDFFQGLVHVAVAWYQAGRGNRVGCERQLEKALRRLGPFAPEHRGVAVKLLLLSVKRAARTVESGSLELAPPFLAVGGKPYGCAVIVWRRASAGEREYLILHRRTLHGSDYEGDWAWTPPSGARTFDETPEETAGRELREETGLELPVVAVDLAREWAVYAAEAPTGAEVVLNEEHDRFLWVTAEEAERLCQPVLVGRSIREVDERLASERP